MKNRKLISYSESEISFTQIGGFTLIVAGVIAIILFGCLDKSSLIAISFFIIMLGVAFAFPKLLEGNDGLSTMRIVVFMVVNVICLLLLKIGWGKDSLECIGLDGWWMGVIAFVFGAKATQTYFESKFAVPKTEPQKVGMAAIEYTNADIAKLAVEQNQQVLKVKFPNILSISDAVHDLNSTDSHVIALYIKDNNTVGIPDKLEIKMPDGTVKTISTEIVKGVGVGKIHINQTDDISNGNSFGSVCCIVVTEDKQKKIVTAGHVFSKGYSTNFHGELTEAEQTRAQINDSEIGNWYFQIINDKTDVALASIENWEDDNKYISFKNKEHYQVKDSDIGKTKVSVISNIYDPKQRDAFILDHNTQWDVQYDDYKTTTKNNVIVIGNSPDRNISETVSRKGDSGGCVFEPSSGNLVGLILGGNAKFTWVLPLNEIFENYKYKLS